MHHLTRRHFLSQSSLGIGAIALSQLLGHDRARAASLTAPANPMAARLPHFAPKAKRVIYLHLEGSPPNLDLFDYKPELIRLDGQDTPDSYLKGRRFAFTQGTPKLMGTPHEFSQYGECGAWMSDAIPHFHTIADEFCYVRSVHTDQFNHAPAQLLLLTGSPIAGRPSLGAWATYGLGTENQDLPGFVVFVSGGSNPSSGKNAWGNGFIPSVFQGVQCRSKGDPILFVNDPPGMSRDLRRLSIDAINDINSAQADELGGEETLTRIAQYELAFRMQASVPETMDLSAEPAHVRERYGATPGESSFANNCLLARRLAERGVRFIQLFDWGWDFHGTNPNEALGDGLRKKCSGMDKPVAALISDLKERGMLDDTLVILGGEFGRTPFREGRTAGGANLGRDHYPDCFTMLMAGGGVKPGTIYGETDPLGFSIANDPVHIHDLQATILHLMGLDHEALTYRFQGRDFRLTDVHGHVVKGLLA
jgi:hypothetical protein